jgi:transposase-like protein
VKRERKICPYCSSTNVKKKRNFSGYICNKCKKTFLTPEVSIVDNDSRVLPKYLNIKKYVTDESEN